MRAALTIAAKDLRQRARDRSAFVVAFLLPFGLAAIFALTLSNVSGESKFTATYAVADLDHGQVAQAFDAMLAKLDFAKTERASTAAEASKLAEEGRVDAAFVVPVGFSAMAAAGQGGEIRVFTDPNSTIGGLVATSIARSFASDIDATQVSVATVLAGRTGSPDPTEVARLAEEARDTPPTAVLNPNNAESELFSSTTYYAIGMAVFFVFFTVEFGVRSLLVERESATLARLLVAPVRPAWIIAGKSIASFSVGLVSMSALVLASTWLLGAEWGNPVGVGLLVVSGVLAAMGLTALVSSVADTPAQAGSYSSVAAVVGGLLGGTFFPVSQGPSLLANLSLITPQAWMMRGFQGLASGGGAVGVLPSVAACLAFAVVLGGIAVGRADRMVAR